MEDSVLNIKKKHMAGGGLGLTVKRPQDESFDRQPGTTLLSAEHFLLAMFTMIASFINL